MGWTGCNQKSVNGSKVNIIDVFWEEVSDKEYAQSSRVLELLQILCPIKVEDIEHESGSTGIALSSKEDELVTSNSFRSEVVNSENISPEERPLSDERVPNKRSEKLETLSFSDYFKY